jgi:hypothetical protein
MWRMWKDRLDAGAVQEQARTVRKATREAEHANWLLAWLSYKGKLTEKRALVVLPRWCNLVGWVRHLLRLHAPGHHHN